MESGADVNAVNARHETALERAVLYDCTYAVRELLLLHAGVNMHDVDGDTALIAALFATEVDLLALLLETNRANLKVLKNAVKTPLMIALRRCDPGRFLTPLLEAGADVAQVDDGGMTVLHRAAVGTNDWDVEYVKPLLSYGGMSVLYAKDVEGPAPVHHAARFGRAKMPEVLGSCGADMAAKGLQGRTIMHHAVRCMDPTDFVAVFAKSLRSSDENKLNVADADGWTSLHLACKTNAGDVVSLLLRSCETAEDCRKMILHKGERGWMALAVAEFHGQENIGEVLRATLRSTNGDTESNSGRKRH